MVQLDYLKKHRFRGLKEAVDRFVSEKKGKYNALPIGDGISVMIVGF